MKARPMSRRFAAKWLVSITGVMTASITLSTAAGADGNRALLDAIKAKPKCNETTVATSLANAEPDADIIYSMLTANCGMSAPYIKEALQQHGKVFAAAAEQFLDHADAIKPKVEEALNSGDTADAILGSFYDFSFAVGFLKQATAASCKGMKGADADGLKKVCALSPRMEAAFEMWSGPIYKKDSENRKKKMTAASPSAPANYSVDPKMAWNGGQKVSNPADSDSWPPTFIATQIVNGNAIFKDASGDIQAFVAVKGLGQVRPGIQLLSIKQFSKNHADCLRFVNKSVGTDDRGFPTDIYNFTATKCPKGK